MAKSTARRATLRLETGTSGMQRKRMEEEGEDGG
jgi:hypothetical protein